MMNKLNFANVQSKKFDKKVMDFIFEVDRLFCLKVRSKRLVIL